MGDLTKVTGVADASISKVDGVASASISKVSGVTKSTGTVTATKWIAGASAGKIFRTTQANAGSDWEELTGPDLGSGNAKGTTIGKNASGNKRWVLHRSISTEEIVYVNNGDEGAYANWTEVNLTNNHVGVDGGPSIAWGNDYWIGAGDDVSVNPAPSDEDVLFVSSDGGDSWTTVALAGQQTNDTGRTACYKDGTTFFFTVQDQIWKTTADPTDAANWSMVQDFSDAQDILAMAFNGKAEPDDLWVCVGQSGEVHTSNDDWATVTSRTGGHGSSNIYGVVWCGGTINKWVTVGISGKIAYSDDGITWTPATTGTTQHLRAVATDNTTIVAVGAAATVLTSTDAINWTSVTHDPVINRQFWSLACDIIGSGMR